VSAWRTVSSEAYAVIITTSMEGSARLTWRRSSSPSISGILMSMITTSGWKRRSSSSAVRPFSAVWMA
jgi:hypothetical protein